MEVKKCIPVVYIIKGEKGVRSGQSMCTETRLPNVISQFKDCLGKNRKVYVIPMIDRKNEASHGESSY